jgi:hypothetical protein
VADGKCLPLEFLALRLINCNGGATEGIFRVPPSISQLAIARENLKCAMDLYQMPQAVVGNGRWKGVDVQDPYLVASLIKAWLSELPIPLLKNSHTSSSSISSSSSSGLVYPSRMSDLTPLQASVVPSIFTLFELIIKNAGITKMTAAALCILFASILFGDRQFATGNLPEQIKAEMKAQSDALMLLYEDWSLQQRFEWM